MIINVGVRCNVLWAMGHTLSGDVLATIAGPQVSTARGIRARPQYIISGIPVGRFPIFQLKWGVLWAI